MLLFVSVLSLNYIFLANNDLGRYVHMWTDNSISSVFNSIVFIDVFTGGSVCAGGE